MNYAVIFAGGMGQRMGNASVPKQFLLVHSKPIIVHTIEHFQKASCIDAIVVVCLYDYLEYMKSLLSQYGLDKVVSVVSGGNCGQQSIFFGLKELERLYGVHENDIVLIHDGVRPLINEDLIQANVDCVKQNGSSVTVSKAIETIVLLNEASTVDKVMDRQYCNVAKAPQAFYLKDILSCHLQAIRQKKFDFIDSAMLMQHYGYKIHTVLSHNENLKITTPLDYYLFKAILEAKENEQLGLR